jgi:hypothetical protein
LLWAGKSNVWNDNPQARYPGQKNTNSFHVETNAQKLMYNTKILLYKKFNK